MRAVERLGLDANRPPQQGNGGNTEPMSPRHSYRDISTFSQFRARFSYWSQKRSMLRETGEARGLRLAGVGPLVFGVDVLRGVLIFRAWTMGLAFATLVYG